MKALLSTSAVAALLALVSQTEAWSQTSATPPKSASNASAGTTAPAAANTGIAEIVVTAARREQNLQKTAIAVTAITADVIAEKGISNVSELTTLAPAVKVGEVGAGGVQITIRGVGNFGGNSYGEPGVAVNLDGVYLARNPGPEGIFYDVSRVEVLKGPQGTLYGRNATGGVLNVLTNDPTSVPGGDITVEGGDYSSFRASGALNIPIAEGVALRIAGQDVQHSGYFSDGYDDENDYAARAKLKLDPTSRFSILLEADFTQTNGKGEAGVFVPFVDPSNPWVGPSDPRSNAVFSNSGFPTALTSKLDEFKSNGFLDNSSHTLSGTVSYDLGFAKATAVVANNTDSVHYLQYAAGFPVSDDTRHDPSKYTTAELRLNSSNSGALKWVVGGFFFDDDLRTQVLADQGYTFSLANTQVNTRSYSGFGEATYSLTSFLRLTAGGRYTSDEKSISGTSTSSITGPPTTYASVCPAAQGSKIVPGPIADFYGATTFGAECIAPIAGQKTFSRFTYKGGIEGDITPRSLVYANIATGFKAGGLNASLNTAPAGSTPSNAYDPETLTAYTIGSKNRFFGNTVQLNGELFYWDYKNKQVPHFGIVQPGNNVNLVVSNAAGATMYGAEFEGIWKPTRNDQFSADVQTLHAEYQDYVYQEIVPAFATSPFAVPATGCAYTPVVGVNGGPGGRGVNGVSTINCSGKPVSFAPRWTLNLAYRHTFDLPGGATLTPGVSSHLEAAFWATEAYLPTDQQKSSTDTDVDVVWTSASRTWSLAGYVHNIEDQFVAQTGIDQVTIGKTLFVPRPPRTFGFRASAKF